MQTLWSVLGCLVFVGLVAWSYRSTRVYAVELAARPEEEYRVAGLDKSAEVGRHALWGISPWHMRRLRRDLDEAAARIARFEQGDTGQAGPRST